MGVLLAACSPGFGLNPSIAISQYGHTAWTARDGFSLGNIYAMAQTPDGYLWLGSEFGLFRFDGVRFLAWQPPPGQRLPDQNINSLLVARDGTLWIGTFGGLATWGGGKLSSRSIPGSQFIASLFEDRDGTVWVGTLGNSLVPGLLCAIKGSDTRCSGQDRSFGRAVWAYYQDSSDVLWAGAESGLWRLRPGPAKRYETRLELIGLNRSDDGRLVIAMHGGGLLGLTADKLEPYPVRRASSANGLMKDEELNANRLLRDRDGGLWIGTIERGLIHTHRGRTDVFTRADGLSGNVVLSVFEDREGNVWVGTTGGLDRFRELPVTSVSTKQGLLSDASQSVLGAADGSIWVGSHTGLTRLKDGKATVFGKAAGLPDGAPQSLYLDGRGRVWVSTRNGLAVFSGGRFVATGTVHDLDVHSISGDKEGNLWLSDARSLLHLREGRFVEQVPWPELGRTQQAKVVLTDGRGVWLSFWTGGGVLYLEKGKIRASYGVADGLGKGHVVDLRLDREGALWAATQDGGLSRLKDGRITTLTTRNGLPCNSVHWSIEDDQGSLWLNTACGLARITRSELDGWIADPNRRITAEVWEAADGVRIRSSIASAYAPRVDKATDGRIWFVTGEGVQVLDPRRISTNPLPPPVHIEQVIANEESYWPAGRGGAATGLRLPAKIRDLRIDFTALSLVAPEKVRFKYRLEGQDPDWREPTRDRQARYTNLTPGDYRFRVTACNDSGVWNETGDVLAFTIAPAFYQTHWFRALCAAALIALLWTAYQFRIRQLRTDIKKLQDVIEAIPGYVWSARPDGSIDFINRRWLEYSGLSLEQGLGWGWAEAIHPEDRDRFIEAWQAAFQSGQPLEAEARVRRADGQYRWLLIRNVPLHSKTGKIVKWYGKSTDIDERKRAEQALKRSEAYLADAQRLTRTGAWASDGTTRPLYWSEEVFRIFGFDPKDGLPSSDEPFQRVHPEDRDRFWRAFHRTIREKVDSEVEYRVVLPDGTVKHVHALAHPVVNSDHELLEVVGTIVDVTDLKRAEEERERLRQLEADLAHINRVTMMGELAASIAHEVNQPLSGVVSNGSACLRWLAGDSPNLAEAREAASRIVRDGKRAGEVIARIRALTKTTPTPRGKLDVNETIREVLVLVGDKAEKESVTIRTQFDHALALVSGDRVQLQQVVLNLVMNAIEAMSGIRGKARELLITTRNIDADQVQVSVQDSGPGIDPAAIGKIFDPFYTTKPDGMGMGLSICRSIIQGHGGRLWATANDGPGTTFHFTLPKHHEEGADEKDAGV
jgi:PAS domain S-box-containing protein